MGKLSDFARENSTFLKLQDGESITVKYKGYEFGRTLKGEKVPQYIFTLQNGKEKVLQSQSNALANFFDDEHGQVKSGDTIKITRHGLDRNTKYEVVIENNVVL